MCENLMDLPNELLFIILSFLSQRDLLSVRLIDVLMSKLSAGSIIERVYFAPRIERIQLFQNIAQSPVFSKSVRELVYDTRLFTVGMVNDEAIYNERFFQQHPLLNFLGRYYSEVELQEGLQRSRAVYSSQLNQQRKLLRNHSDRKMLLHGLKKMPGIERLLIADSFEPQQSTFTRKDHEWYRASCIQEFGGVLLPSSSPLSHHIPGHINTLDWNADRSQKLDDHIWNSFASAGIRLKALHLGSENTLLPLEVFDLSPSASVALSTVCSRLERLQISLRMKVMPASANQTHHTTQAKSLERTRYQLLQFLRSLRNLEELSIGQYLRDCVAWVPACMDQMWPHLALIDLNRVKISLEDYKKFGCNHKDSLRGVTLRHVEVIGGTWHDLFEWFGKNLSIDRLHVNGLTPKNGTRRPADLAFGKVGLGTAIEKSVPP